jgi:hypothetical protein
MTPWKTSFHARTPSRSATACNAWRAGSAISGRHSQRIERELPAIVAGLEGFVGQTLVKTGPRELVVVGRWASPEAAAAGAAVIGPGAFNTWVAPRATGQDRVVGEVVSDIGWGS